MEQKYEMSWIALNEPLDRVQNVIFGRSGPFLIWITVWILFYKVILISCKLGVYMVLLICLGS